MARLYHPKTGAEITVPDDEAHIAVLAESGWEPAPEPEARTGYEPEPVTYAPVAKKTAAKTAKKPESSDK